MANTFTTTTFSSTYKDDFRDSDNYHRILFNAGKALQARELTQMQTIIQSEIGRLGSNLFKEGGVVQPAGASLDQYEYIKLATGQLPNDTATIIGKTFTVAAPAAQVQVKISGVIEASGSDPDTLIVQYVSTSSGTSGTSPIRVGNSQTLENSTLGSGYNMITAATNAAGKGLRFSMGEGVIFAQGHFIFVEKQTIYPSKYSTSFEGDIGYKVTQDVVTVSDTTALYDNQGASPNLAAPGADRYRIRLTLTKKSDLTATDNFVYVLRIKDTEIVDKTTVTDSYNELNKTLALRTKEESGNYISSPITAKFNDLNDSNLQLEVSQGVFYIDGYRVQAPATKITVPKAQDTVTAEDEIIVAQYGNYVLCDYTDNKGFPNIETFVKVNLRSATDYGGSTIGTARVRAIEESTGNNIALYLFAIEMNSGQSFGLTRSIGTGVSDYMNIVLENGAATLKNTAENNLLFPLPSERPQQTGQSYSTATLQKRYTFTTDGSGNVSSVAVGVTGGKFTNTSQWVASRVDSSIDNSIAFSTSSPFTTFSVSGGDAAQDYEVIATITKSTPSARTKSLQNTTKTIAWPGDASTDAAGNKYIDLDKTDIFEVSSIKLVDSDGADISTNFTIDNGQRDNYYGFGRVVQKAGTSIPTSDIFVRFKYFTHGAGDFFDVTSYVPAEVGYDEIPSHRQNNGDVVSLRDVVDFRPVATKSAGGIAFDSDGVGGSGIINLLPPNTNTLTGDIIYYESRNDRLVALPGAADTVNVTGAYKVISGVSDLDPKYPDIPTSSMNLMNISLNPYTLNESDLTTTLIPNKKFQMKDIAELEQRIDELQELTTLSLLELNTSSLSVIDSNGNPRTKAGFLVDNFKDYTFSATDRDEYRATIDDLEGLLTCKQYANNVRMIYDSADASTTTERNGDLVTLPISSHQSFVDQNLATETINVNPFAVITNFGACRLSPASDEWAETKYAPDRIVTGGTERINRGNIFTGNINAWRNSWIGRPVGNQVTVRGRVSVRRDIIGDRIIDVDIIPFMRSRLVYFKAEGLRPNTKHFPFFDGVNIANYVREESSFLRFGTTTTDVGNQYTNRTSHPNGAGDLISNDAGEIIGSFIIPSNNSLKFRTGSREFKLLDISADNEDNATSKAIAGFTSTGVLNTRQRTIASTRVEDTFRLIQVQMDPVAETFFVSGREYPNGVFITKTDLFFSSKDDNIPVRCEIRPVENGIPTKAPLPDAYAYVAPSNVNIPGDTGLLSSVQSAATTFTFEEPIYLTPDREYAVVVLAESTDYNIYVAKTYDFQLGSTEKRINRQPTMGSLFTSQNGFTWTPDQTRDLMFKLYRAEFSSSGSAIIENVSAPSKLLDNNPFSVDSGDATIRVLHEGHGFSKNNKVFISGLTAGDSYAGIKGSSLNGTRTITSVDWTGYTFEADSSATSTIRTGGNSVIASQNTQFDVYVPNVQTIIPDETSLSGKVKLTTGQSYAGNRNTSTANIGKATSFTPITLNEFNYRNNPGVILTDSNETALISGNRSTTLQLDLTTTDTKVSPVIDLQRLSFTTFENIIDRQDSSATSTYNVPISFVNDTHPTEGTHAAKHITSPVTLADQAVGLKILFAANRPQAAGFKVYYKTGSSDDNLDEINWVQVSENTNNPADEIKTVYREYEYLAGGIGGNLNSFTQFQVKIVMTSTNSSKIPTIKDLRTIAMVT